MVNGWLRMIIIKPYCWRVPGRWPLDSIRLPVVSVPGTIGADFSMAISGYYRQHDEPRVALLGNTGYGDSTFYKVAVTHADTTMKNHFRPDYSSYHVVDYDTISGKRIAQQTHQGYADSSAWARGQAWGLYGYTVCYRETKDPKYLAQADQIAAYILSRSNQTEDLIPYWDYDV